MQNSEISLIIIWDSESAFAHPWTICCNSFIVFSAYAWNDKDNHFISNSSPNKSNAIQIVTPDIGFSKGNSLLMVQSRMWKAKRFERILKEVFVVIGLRCANITPFDLQRRSLLDMERLMCTLDAVT